VLSLLGGASSYDAAIKEEDLRMPPGNRFEHLRGVLQGWCSVRVNRQYRLIFKWVDGVAVDTYLDPHVY
jgi:proteic killer suppression protein